MLDREVFNNGIFVMIGKMVRKDPWDDVIAGLYYDGVKDKITDDEFMYSVEMCKQTMEFFPSIRQILENTPTALDETYNAPKMIETANAKKFDKAAEARAYENTPEDLSQAIMDSLDKYPNCQRPAHITDRNAIRIWLGKQYGDSGFTSVNDAISSIADTFGIPFKYSEKWVNLDLNREFDHLKG